MPENPAREALEELLDYLEIVETQSGALMALLRDNGMVTDENLKPYLEQSATATEVKSRAIRARFNFLFKSDQTTKPSTEANPTPPNERPTETTAKAEDKADSTESDASRNGQGGTETTPPTTQTRPGEKAA